VTSSPRISVIVPTLNEEKLLDGMLRQFTPELRERHGLELIVSDGGSIDRTLEIARRHDCTVVENLDGTKQTISLGRNLGAARARGGILVFLNADTLVADPDTFFRRMAGELRDRSLAAVTCSVGVYPEDQRVSDRLFHGFYNWLFAMMNVTGMGMGRGECHVIPREVFLAAGGYAARIAAGEDYDMFRRLKRAGRIRFLKDVRVYESPRRYRQYGYLYVSASWFLNFLAVFFLRRSILSEWKPVR
jgi:glycosyltransferase involved in cell wall biosynthesis